MDSLRPPDLRVLYVNTDDTDTRYEEWRKVILESKTITYEDVPLEGPLSVLNWFRQTHTHTHTQVWWQPSALVHGVRPVEGNTFNGQGLPQTVDFGRRSL